MNLNQIKIEHVISFSDALFAFSITFMALSIQIPTFSSNITDLELTRRLGQLLIPNIIHYVVSFIVVGMYWVSYHRIFEHIRRADINVCIQLAWKQVQQRLILDSIILFYEHE